MAEALLPWVRVRHVDAREADRLAARGPIPFGIVQPPSWDVPAGAPQPAILLGAGL
jgi:hypothetical protein